VRSPLQRPPTLSQWRCDGSVATSVSKAVGWYSEVGEVRGVELGGELYNRTVIPLGYPVLPCWTACLLFLWKSDAIRRASQASVLLGVNRNEKVGFLYTVLHSKSIRNANKCYLNVSAIYCRNM
jgi:hypothetical protein